MESYEYRGMMATAWDLLRGDTSSWPDRLFYRDLIVRYSQPVLDVGCGTVRLLLDYLVHGIDIAEQIEATEDRYEVLRDGAVVATEMHVRSPATRWYTQQQGLHLYEEAGFTSMQIFKQNHMAYSQKEAQPMITGIGHVAFRVTSLQRALDFYCTKLGFSEAFRLERQGEPSPWILYIQIAPGPV